MRRRGGRYPPCALNGPSLASSTPIDTLPYSESHHPKPSHPTYTQSAPPDTITLLHPLSHSSAPSECLS